MTDTISTSTAAAGTERGLAARAFGVLTAPRATYAEVARRPRALGMVLLVFVISAAALATFMSTEVGRTAFVDQAISQIESYGRHPTAAQVAVYERLADAGVYAMPALQFGSVIVVALVVSGLAWAVFNALLGGDATFKQVFAIVAHSGVIVALQQIFVLPLDYARESLSNPTTIAVFLPFLDEGSFLSHLFGSIDLFIVWWTVSLAIGLGVLYKRRTGPIAMTLLFVYAVVAIVIAAVKTALAGA